MTNSFLQEEYLFLSPKQLELLELNPLLVPQIKLHHIEDKPKQEENPKKLYTLGDLL
jgi:hypothetical protein